MYSYVRTVNPKNILTNHLKLRRGHYRPTFKETTAKESVQKQREISIRFFSEFHINVDGWTSIIITPFFIIMNSILYSTITLE